jgi:two-component system sensor histidine kinase YesM
VVNVKQRIEMICPVGSTLSIESIPDVETKIIVTIVIE